MKTKIEILSNHTIREIETDLTEEQVAKYRQLRGCMISVEASQLRGLLLNVVEIRDWYPV